MADFIPKTPPIWQTQLSFELNPADPTLSVAPELLIGGGSLSGLVCVSVDIGQPNPEYIIGVLAGNVVTISLRNVDPLNPTISLGAFTSIHRQGAVVKITDFATIQIMRNILNGDQGMANIIKYTTPLTPVNPEDIADKAYVDAISVAGAPDASTTAKGSTRLSASPNVTLGNPTITIASPAVITLANHGLTLNDTVQFTTSGSLPTGISPSTNYYVISAGLTANAFEISATPAGAAINTSGIQSGTHTLIKTTPVALGVNDYRVSGNDYGVSAVGTDAYAITLLNPPSAYSAGQTFAFKADVANTGACTLNINGLGAKALKVNGTLDPQNNYIKIGAIILVKYDGTNFQILSVAGKPSVSQSGEEIYGVPNGGTDAYSITVAPVPPAYVDGMVFRFKADVANTGAATLNVNTLGAINIVKSFNLALADGDIKAGQLVEVQYDSTTTTFQLLSPVTNFSPTFVPNADELLTAYLTYVIPLVSTSATALQGWVTNTSGTIAFSNPFVAGAAMKLSSSTLEWVVSTLLIGTGGQASYRIDEGKIIRVKWFLNVTDLSDIKGWGFVITPANIYTAQTDVTNGEIRFVLNAATLYAQNANGTATSTNIGSGITLTDWNTYEIVFTPGVDIKFYINGVLKATHTTNIPTSGTLVLAYGASANGRVINSMSPVVSIQR